MGNRIPLKVLKDAMIVYPLPDDLINRVVAHMHISYYPTNNQIKTFIRHEWSNYDETLKQDHNGKDSKRYLSLRRYIDKEIQESLSAWQKLHTNSFAKWTKKQEKRQVIQSKQSRNQSTGSFSLPESAAETDDELLFNKAIRKANVGQSG